MSPLTYIFMSVGCIHAVLVFKLIRPLWGRYLLHTFCYGIPPVIMPQNESQNSSLQIRKYLSKFRKRSHTFPEISISKVLATMAGIVLKFRSLLSKKAMLLLYHALVGSKLRYGLICWATASQTLLNKINVAHNTIVTYLTFSKRCSRTWPLYQQLKVLPLNILIQIEQAKTMYKFEHKMLPQVFDNYFLKPTHQHNTRYASIHNNFQVVRISSAKEKSLLKYYGPKVWASIPLDIKNSLSLKVFINSYRNHLIGNYSEYFG